MKMYKQTALALAVAFSLSGCETLGLGGAGPAGGGEGGIDGSGASTSGIGQAGGADGSYIGDPLQNPASPLSKRIIHFAFDSSEVAADYLPIVTAHAEFLVANPDRSVLLEGHADERGTREYNIALGERRGNSVADLLKLQGVTTSQIQVTSYGEEKPVNFGHDEISWEQNRRVEIIYSGE